MTRKSKISMLGAALGVLFALSLGYMLRELLTVIGYFVGSFVIVLVSSNNLGHDAYMLRVAILMITLWSLFVVLPFALFGAWFANKVMFDSAKK